MSETFHVRYIQLLFSVFKFSTLPAIFTQAQNKYNSAWARTVLQKRHAILMALSYLKISSCMTERKKKTPDFNHYGKNILCLPFPSFCDVAQVQRCLHRVFLFLCPPDQVNSAILSERTNNKVTTA
jgi:hypothetical protein